MIGLLFRGRAKMEPIGTIIQYFPFIDNETKTILENVMMEASDYYDFVQRLCELVLTTDSPVMVVYFAIHFSMIALEYKPIDKIREKYGHHQILGPNLFASSAYLGRYEDLEKVHEMADAILVDDPADWIKLEMYFMKFEADMKNYPKTMYKESTMDKIRELIDSDPNFGYYEIVLMDHLALRSQVDGDSKEQLRCVERGIEYAEKFDDKLREAHLLIQKGFLLMNSDRRQSRDSFQRAYQIVESYLEIPGMYSNIVYYQSILDATRGEFDKAIEGCMRVITIRERIGVENGNAASFLAIYYNMIDDPESGLEWGRLTEEQFSSRPYLINLAILFQIWSLILLKRIIEAQALLDSSRESILKSGSEYQFGWFHFVSGLLELEHGNSELAISNIEQALKIFERMGTLLLAELIFLYYLARIEIFSNVSEGVLSNYLAILEEKAISDDLPGFLGLVLLLKADIAIENGDEILLGDVVAQIRPLVEKKKISFLNVHLEQLQRKQ